MSAAERALRPSRARSQRSGFALVITLVVVALLTVIVTAFLTSATNDRLVSRAYLNRVRAEQAAEAGLAQAIATFRAPDLLPNFAFAVSSDVGGLPVLLPLKPDGSVDPTGKRPLSSTGTSGAKATLTLSAGLTKQVDFVELKDKPGPTGVEVGRFAYLADEANGRQNVLIAGDSDRKSLQDPGQLPLIAKAPVGGSPTPASGTELDVLREKRAFLFSPATLNQIAPANYFDPVAEDYYFTSASPQVMLTPDGKPRVNLERLRQHIEGLPVDQAAGNMRAKLVDRLLNPGESGTDWNGGNLAVLANTGRYSPVQQKQIIANLIDYLDSDVFPTTDDIDNPTYFGVEGKADANGDVRGHPFVNFVGTGLIFNLGSGSFQGQLNSTRVLVYLGLVNPWSKDTNSWSTFYANSNDNLYPEIELEIEGSASGGTLGGEAKKYFKERITPQDSSNQLFASPADTIPPRRGFSFPTTASGFLYANFNDILNTTGRQPAGMSFSGIHFRFKKLRIKYKDSNGRVGVVQVLDKLGTISGSASTPDITLPNGSGSRIYKLTAQDGAAKQDFHLIGDPRLNFLPTQWKASASLVAANDPPSPASALSILQLADRPTSDFPPSPVPDPGVTSHLWYTNTNFAKNFYVKSPDGSVVVLESIGELGYIHTGIPWETLRFYVTDNDAGSSPSPKAKDRDLLAYVQTGTVPAKRITELQTAPGETAPPAPIPVLAGAINVNTNKAGALQSLFLGATALSDASATARAKGEEPDPDVVSLVKAVVDSVDRPFGLPGDFLRSSGVRALTNAGTDDFARETLIRRTANVLSAQSTRFTVYVVGEARDKLVSKTNTVGKATLRAEVELRTNSAGRPVPVVVSKSFQ